MGGKNKSNELMSAIN